MNAKREKNRDLVQQPEWREAREKVLRNVVEAGAFAARCIVGLRKLQGGFYVVDKHAKEFD